MYCPTCGIALSHQMKYCNGCGGQLIATQEAAHVERLEKRLDDYLDGLFWITFFGLGLILGGLALMTKVLGLGQGLVIAYLVLSSLAFIINFGLSLREIIRMIQRTKEARGAVELGRLDTNELNPLRARTTLEPAPSVTENTTRALEPVYRERKSE